MKRAISIILALSVTILALVYALWDVDFEQLSMLLAKGNYLAVFPFGIFLVLFFMFTGMRWKLILYPLGDYSLKDVTPAMMIGFGGNNVLPAHLGELVRTAVFARQFQKSRSGVLSTLVLERLLDVFAIMFFYSAAVVAISPFPESIRLGSNVAATAMVCVVVGIVFLLRYPVAILAKWERWMAWLPAMIHRRGTAMLKEAIAGLASLKSISLLLRMLSLSLLKWMAGGGMVWVSLWMYDAVIPFTTSMIVVAISALAVTLPAAPGYFGSVQAAFVFALTPFGIAPEQAVAASLFYLVAQWLPVTITGAYFFLYSSATRAEIDAEVSQLRGG